MVPDLVALYDRTFWLNKIVHHGSVLHHSNGLCMLIDDLLARLEAKLSIILVFSDSWAASTRNYFCSIDFQVELAMFCSTAHLCSNREYHWSNLRFHKVIDHIITNKV